MAAYDLEEQEQLSEMKAWWEKNGNLVTWVAVAISVAVLGWQGWNWYQRNQAAQAGAMYSALAEAVNAKDAAKARQLAGELTDKFGRTVNAELGAMLASRVDLDAGDAKSAKSKLEWAATKGADELLRDLARLRLATLQLDEKAYDAALKTLETAPAPAFSARYEDLRGDIFFAKGAVKEAREAYQKALDAASKVAAAQGSPFKSAIETKLDALGGN